MKSRLDHHFKCPKELKIMLNGQSRESRMQMYEAHKHLIDWKRKSQIKRGDKNDNAAA